MRTRVCAILGAAAVVGLLLQTAGLWLLWIAWHPRPDFSPWAVFELPACVELDLVVGLVAFLAGSVFCAATVETTLRAARTHAPAAPGRRMRRSMLDRLTAAALTSLASVGLLWAVWALLAHGRDDGAIDHAGIGRRELKAYRRLRQLMQAQDRYIEKDWDEDGERSYALFPVHLWQSVRESDGEPVRVDLIPRELAFAMVYSFALDGYVFDTLHFREPETMPGPEAGPEAFPEIDYHTDYAIVAVPKYYRMSGLISFLADRTGIVYASHSQAVRPGVYPADPTAGGWIPIRSQADLRELQSQDDYVARLNKAASDTRTVR